MTQSLIALALVVALWALVAKGLERWRLTAPIVMVIAGVAIGFSTAKSFDVTLNTVVAQRVAEIILAVLLFVDATDVKGGLLGSDRGSASRLLFVALPLSLAAATGLGLWLLPGLGYAVLIVIACVVVPIDFASAPSILRDPRIPAPVRNLLNVEGGYNDGIVSPAFIAAVALVVGESRSHTVLETLADAFLHAVIAVVVGLAVGTVLAFASNATEHRGLMTEQSMRLLFVAAPVLSYGVSVGVEGNGFVSAFVCGIAMRSLRRSDRVAEHLELVDDVGFLLALSMWFVFGAATVFALADGVSWKAVLFCVLAITVVRIVPVCVSLWRSRWSWRDRLAIGYLGPRGTTSIVFGLLAFNLIDGAAEGAILDTMVVLVLGSLLLHGAGSSAALRLYARRPVTAADSP